jgi:hypothetical protein
MLGTMDHVVHIALGVVVPDRRLRVRRAAGDGRA